MKDKTAPGQPLRRPPSCCLLLARSAKRYAALKLSAKPALTLVSNDTLYKLCFVHCVWASPVRRQLNQESVLAVCIACRSQLSKERGYKYTRMYICLVMCMGRGHYGCAQIPGGREPKPRLQTRAWPTWRLKCFSSPQKFSHNNNTRLLIRL